MGVGKKRLILLFTFVIVLVVTSFSVSGNETSYMLRPINDSPLSDDAEIGSVVLMERGTEIYLGGNEWSFSTVLGEYNTFNGSHFVKYLYDELNHNATFAGHSLVLYDWYATFSNTTQVLVDDMRFIVQYWQEQAGGRWRELDLYDYSFLTPIETANSLTFGQRYTDGFSSLDVWYTVHNYDMFKITLNFTAQNTELYRFQWQLTGIDGEPQLNNKSLSFDEVNIGWSDSELNATYEWAVATKKLDISFDNLTIGAGETYTLDPSVNPVIGADSDDDWYNFDDGVGWTHNINSLYVYVREYHQNFYYTGNVRFALSIPQGATINSADMTMYEYDDSGDNDVEVFRIDEVNCGPLESDSSIPNRDWSVYGVWDTDGVGSEWGNANVTDLVQDQVNLGSWVSGYYLGLNFNQTATGAGAIHSFYDYQQGTNHAYLNVTYTTAGGTEYEAYPSGSLALGGDTSLVAAFSKTLVEGFALAGITVLAAAFAVTLAQGFTLVGTTALASIYSKTLIEGFALAGTTSVFVIIQILIVEGFALTGGVSLVAAFVVTLVQGFALGGTIALAAAFVVTLAQSFSLGGTVALAVSYVKTLVEGFSLSGTISAFKVFIVTLVEGFTVGVGVNITKVAGAVIAASMIYELFLSVEVWGYIGPALLIMGGYVLLKREQVLGVLWFLLECLIVAQYLLLVETTPHYWWHVYIIIIGGLIPFGFAMVGRRR